MRVAALIVALTALTLIVIFLFRLIIDLILCLAPLDAKILVKALEDPLDGLVVEELLKLLRADVLGFQDFFPILLVLVLFLVINVYVVIIIAGGWLFLHHLLRHDGGCPHDHLLKALAGFCLLLLFGLILLLLDNTRIFLFQSLLGRLCCSCVRLLLVLEFNKLLKEPDSLNSFLGKFSL